MCTHKHAHISLPALVYFVLKKKKSYRSLRVRKTSCKKKKKIKLLRGFDVCLTNSVSMYKYWEKKNAWIDLNKETQCVLVFIDVISNPLMYLFFWFVFFFFVLFWDFEQRINKTDSDSC